MFTMSNKYLTSKIYKPQHPRLSMEDSNKIINQNDIRYKLPVTILRDFFYNFPSETPYSTKKNYHTIIRTLLNNNNYITIISIKIALKKKNTTLKQAAIKMFISFLREEKGIIIPQFTYPKLKKQYNIQEEPPTLEEIKLIVEEFKKDIKERYRLHDYSLLIEFMFRLGCRVQEVLKLKIKDFEMDNWKDKTEWHYVNIVNSKGNKSRQLPVPQDLMRRIFNKSIIEKTYNNKDLFVFDFFFELYRKRKFKKYKNFNFIPGVKAHEDVILFKYIAKTKNDILTRLKELSKKAIGREIKTHTLRSAKATDLDNNGVGITKIRDYLGHVDISTTSRYLRPSHKEMVSEIKKKDKY